MYVGSSYIIRVMHSRAVMEFHNTPDGRIFNFWCCLQGKFRHSPKFPSSVFGGRYRSISNMQLLWGFISLSIRQKLFNSLVFTGLYFDMDNKILLPSLDTILLFQNKGETQQWVRFLYPNHFKLLVYFSFTINT